MCFQKGADTKIYLYLYSLFSDVSPAPAKINPGHATVSNPIRVYSFRMNDRKLNFEEKSFPGKN